MTPARLKQLRRLIAEGNAEAQHELGWHHAAVLRWQAETNNATDQYTLGQQYETGMGVPRDNSKAAKWYRLAADQGHAAAQYSLAGLYEAGLGVPRDDAEALKWFTRAAEQGNTEARRRLGLPYDDEYYDDEEDDYRTGEKPNA